jgi:hypothetical protein
LNNELNYKLNKHSAILGAGLRLGKADRTMADLVRRYRMKRFVSFLMAILSAVTLLGAFPAMVGADPGVPFKGSAELTAAAGGTFVGTGQGTLLGRFTEGTSTLSENMDGSFTVMVTLTAANGDKVFKMATGNFTSTTTFVGEFTVLGGTGRFVNATGKGQVVMVSADSFAHVAQTYAGTIQF